jgi:lipoate-protein ligase A
MPRLFHHAFSSPVENLAADEELLQAVNNGQHPTGILRLWESRSIFVVLGLSKTITQDVNAMACKRDKIPILKRCSGGGTVLQGPGCFNYSYILPIQASSMLESVSSTTRYILSLVQQTLRDIVPNSEQKGISDLVDNNIKFSGNAQRRLKHAILFHGTILYKLNPSLVSQYLKEPPIQPAYRKNRPHQLFIKNISSTYAALSNAFEAQTSDSIHPSSLAISNETISKIRSRSLN